MEQIVFEKPYKFIPPIRTRFFSQLVQRLRLHQWHLRKFEGVESYEVRHKERLKASIDRGDAIVIAPNHSRNADPMSVGWLTVETNSDFYAIANWHLFQRSFFEAWAIRLMGGYSIFREGMDRQSLETSLQILEDAERPLMIFPEGSMTRNNDWLHPLLEGVAFIARTAAKRIEKKGAGRRVVIHPVGVKYVYRGGDLRKTLEPTIRRLEKRLGYLSLPETPLLERVARLGMGILAAKEVEMLGCPQTGTFRERRDRLIDGMLAPLEQKWGIATPAVGVVARTKDLRSRMVPVIQNPETSRTEKDAVERDMERAYYAQQVACYPDAYFEGTPYQERLFETVERLEEDVTDRVTTHGGLHVILDVDEPIVVSPERVRGADPLMDELAARLRTKLAELAQENHPLPPEEIGDFRKYCRGAGEGA